MVRLICFLFLLGTNNLFAQLRFEKLVIEKNQRFIISESDILVVDTLVMNDSSSIVLNGSKKENFIHATEVLVGRNCSILGIGKNGARGKVGDQGARQQAPCSHGAKGKDAWPGDVGGNGINLSLYFDNMRFIDGSVLIDLTGGHGGDGGKGGRGGDGGSGTRWCNAGDGGKGGTGGRGGNGGQGGTLNMSCKKCGNLLLLVGDKLIIKNLGGFGGLGGEPGDGGEAGSGHVKDGRDGEKGSEGVAASQGKVGAVYLKPN